MLIRFSPLNIYSGHSTLIWFASFFIHSLVLILTISLSPPTPQKYLALSLSLSLCSHQLNLPPSVNHYAVRVKHTPLFFVSLPSYQYRYVFFLVVHFFFSAIRYRTLIHLEIFVYKKSSFCCHSFEIIILFSYIKRKKKLHTEKLSFS